MEKEKIDLVVQELLKKSGSQVNVKLEDHFPGNRLAGGKYSMGSHTITLYIEEIKNQCDLLFSDDEHFLDYFAVVFAHEIGHAEDGELAELAARLDHSRTELERRQVNLKIEENAWMFAEELLSHMDQSFLQKIIYHSLKPYRDQLQLEPA